VGIGAWRIGAWEINEWLDFYANITAEMKVWLPIGLQVASK